MHSLKYRIKYKIIDSLFLDKQVRDRFYSFKNTHVGYSQNNKLKAVDYIMRLNKAAYERKNLNSVELPIGEEKYREEPKSVKLQTERCSVEECINQIKEYDVISFDIFDTALYRKVEYPNDVFTIMAMEMGHNDFLSIRKNAENLARDRKYALCGTREIVLSEIYEVLEEYYGIDPKWLDREIELELELSVQNPYIWQVFHALKQMEKTVIFTSDMYLPKSAIERMLKQHGYEDYDAFYLSNETGLRKGEGTLQKRLIKDFPGKKIIHIGDSQDGDYEKSIKAGIDAYFNPDARMRAEPHMDVLEGSFYRALINNTLNNGTWKADLSYEHGFRVGGILSVGFCDYINRVATQKKVDKIFFCARDCEVLWQIYNEQFQKFDNEYIAISRYAIMGVTSEKYLYDWSNRYILRHADKCRSTKTIETVLKEAGFPYLVDYLEEDNIDRYLFPSAIKKRKLEEFVLSHADIIKENNRDSLEAAIQYFKEMIGDSTNIMIVDVGWSGTCITALKYFIEKYFPEQVKNISGVLMCTSRGKALSTSMEDGSLDSYIYSPKQNMDFTRFVMPGGRKTVKQTDLLHMPLEYLFTSTERSLVRYTLDNDGSVAFEYVSHEPANKEEILNMQKGMKDFAKAYAENALPYLKDAQISPYVAFGPLKTAIENPAYCHSVYQNFVYDAFSAPYEGIATGTLFGSLFEDNTAIQRDVTSVGLTTGKKQILCVTPELVYTGAPRSLLRICKVIASLGYEPIVWSAKPGPFIKEYEANNIPVFIVTEKDLHKKEIINSLHHFEMAICNTIVTDKYATLCGRHLPTVWYIREATNIMDFCRNNPERLHALRNSRDLCCVSQYAADALAQYANYPIRVVPNAVEDEVDMALPYLSGSGEKIKFVQFGTMEYRKGYDVLLAAYKLMPKEYQEKSELYFAGGFINSGTPYCDYLFGKMKNEPNVHYLGVVTGERNKIETLSKMDVVVVASRDESCSLVALEGAMLSKPLIVTENVGAKYMVGDANGFVVETDDAESLKVAMMKLIDCKSELSAMGVESRKYYEKYASMQAYTEDIKNLIESGNKENVKSASLGDLLRKKEEEIGYSKYESEAVIVSLTSHPERMEKIHLTIESLLNQTSKPQKILLWLSMEQFPNKEEGLPEELLALCDDDLFEIRWTEDDLKPHKKYYYAASEYTEFPIIIVDDDVIYDATLVEKLMRSYRKFPHAISCMRANLMMINPEGQLRPYDSWLMDYKTLLDTPSYQLLPTGVGGVLYPPHSLPKEAFNTEAIKRTCLLCDDIWLKLMATHNGYATVVPMDYCGYTNIEGTQEVALWKTNVHRNNNDVSLENILKYYGEELGDAEVLLDKIRTDRFCPIG